MPSHVVKFVEAFKERGATKKRSMVFPDKSLSQTDRCNMVILTEQNQSSDFYFV